MLPPAVASPTRLPQPPASSQRVDEHNAAETASRPRSLLPQRASSLNRGRPASLYHAPSAAISGSDTAGTDEDQQQHQQRQGLPAREDAARPNRQQQQQQHHHHQQGLEAAQAGHDDSSRARGEASKTKGSMMPPPPPSTTTSQTRVGRSQSLRKSNTASSGTGAERTGRATGPPSAAAAAVNRSHTRQASTGGTNTSNGRSTSRPSSRSNTTSSSSGRPPSIGRPPSAGRPPSSSGSVAAGQNSHTRGSSRSGTKSDAAGLTRSSSVKEGTTVKQHARTTSALPSLQSRPQFNTYQQHYSPKKNLAPKPATASYLPSTSTAAKSASKPGIESAWTWSEQNRRQTELLQLHLTYLAAGPCLEQYKASAERQLRKKFEDLGRRSEAVKRGERDERTALNLRPLKEWGATAGPGGSAENLQVLGNALRDVTVLMGSLDPPPTGDETSSKEALGRFEAAISTFEKWLARSEDVWAQRGPSGPPDSARLEILEPLPKSWFADVTQMQRRVDVLLRDVGSLDAPLPGSSVGDLVSMVAEQLNVMAAELRVVRQIAGSVMDRERRWVDEMVHLLEPV